MEVSAGVGELILDLNIEWRSVVSFTLRPPYLRGTASGSIWNGEWL